MLCSGADKVIHRGALAINLLVIQKSRGDRYGAIVPVPLAFSVTCELI